MTKNKNRRLNKTKQSKTQNIFEVNSGYPHHFILLKNISTLYEVKTSHISIYQHTGKSFISRSVFDENLRIFCDRIFKFKCHTKLASTGISFLH